MRDSGWVGSLTASSHGLCVFPCSHSGLSESTRFLHYVTFSTTVLCGPWSSSRQVATPALSREGDRA